MSTLETLMHRVTEKECTPATVMAACNCASRIIDFAKVHIELDRIAEEKAARLEKLLEANTGKKALDRSGE